MKKCLICGMGQTENPSHTSDYKGIGAHEFKASTSEVEISEDIVVNFGGQLKAVGENGFEGYLVRFSSSEDPDLVGDFFTKSTEFFIEDGAVIPLLYDHGLNATMKKTKIGRATVSYTDEGLFIKGELETAENYKKFVKEIKDKLIDAGKAGLSSGAASHLVTRKQVKKGINEILHWGVAEASVTPAATEPKNVAVSLKSYFENREDPIHLEEPESTKAVESGGQANGNQNPPAQTAQAKTAAKSATDGGERDPEDQLALNITGMSMKGIYKEKLAEKTPCVWEYRSALDEVYRDIANAASVSDITGVSIDVEEKVKEAKMEEAALEIPIVVKQINDWVEKGGNSEGSRYFYIRSVFDTTLSTAESVKSGLGNGLVLDEHSERVVSAVEEYANLGASLVKALEELQDRCKKKIEFRQNDPVKSGRTLSKATTDKLKLIKDKVDKMYGMKKDLSDNLDALISLAEPQKAVDQVTKLQMDFALTRNQTALTLEELPLS